MEKRCMILVFEGVEVRWVRGVRKGQGRLR
jgi:hypothetical protein